MPDTSIQGHSSLSRDRRTSQDSTSPNMVYVIPHLSSDESDHFAHLPALLSALGERINIAAVVEKGTPPAAIPGVQLLLQVPGHNRLGRIFGTFRAIHRCSRAGYRTYFVRYSRLFLIALITTYPLYRHRIYLWRSGLPNFVEPEQRFALKHRLGHMFNWILSQFVHCFVTGPESMLPRMSQIYGIPWRKMRLLYNDIDSTRFRPLSETAREAARQSFGWSNNEFVVLFVHRLSYRKGARLLAPLFDSLSTAIQDSSAVQCSPTPRTTTSQNTMRLVIVGDGPERPLLEQQASGPSRSGRMQLLRAIPNRDLPELYGSVDCVVVPSYEEGFPRVVLEAMASATPVVTTNAGGTTDVVGPTHPYISPTGDLDSLCENLHSVFLASPEDRRQLGMRQRARAQERFSPQRVAEMIEDIL